MSDQDDRDIQSMINDSEKAMADALAQEFHAIDGGDGNNTILDYVAVAKVMDANGQISFRHTTRHDSHRVETLGLLEYGRIRVEHTIRRDLGAIE